MMEGIAAGNDIKAVIVKRQVFSIADHKAQAILQVEYALGTDSHFLNTTICTPVDDFTTHMFANISIRLGAWPRFLASFQAYRLWPQKLTPVGGGLVVLAEACSTTARACRCATSSRSTRSSSTFALLSSFAMFTAENGSKYCRRTIRSIR